jgi:hypothetical protein
MITDENKKNIFENYLPWENTENIEIEWMKLTFFRTIAELTLHK